MDKQSQILHYIRLNPFISQQELAEKVGLSRSATAGYISNLTKQGEIRGRAYVLRDSAAVVCIGTTNHDSKAHAKQRLRTRTANPVTYSESCGGVARNVAENLARLGVKATLLSCVGNDKQGMWVLEETRNSGVDVSQVKVLPDERTGTYTALLDITGEMFICLADLDICDHITPAMIDERWSHIAAAQTVFLDTNVSADCLDYVISRCRDEHIQLYIDPVSLPDAEKLPDDLTGVDTIFPNREEAGLLAGGMEVTTVDDCREASRKIKQKGARHVVVTLGEQGVFYSSEEEEWLIPVVETDIVDVTGAGDAFASGYMFGILRGESMKKACELGLAASSLTLRTDLSVSPKLNAEVIYETNTD